jgi:hypothetical protein
MSAWCEGRGGQLAVVLGPKWGRAGPLHLNPTRTSSLGRWPRRRRYVSGAEAIVAAERG